MRKLAILTFVSLDGVMQGPTGPDEDPSNRFTQGGWAQHCWDDVMQQVMVEAMTEPYDLLLGRNTYDTFAQHFAAAGPDNPVAAKLNQAKKYVVSTTSDALPWQNSTLIADNVVESIKNLKKLDGPLLQVHGSWQLIQLLLEYALIDEFRIWTFPEVVGSGKRLFDQGTEPVNLELVKTAACPTGAIMQIYTKRSLGIA